MVIPNTVQKKKGQNTTQKIKDWAMGTSLKPVMTISFLEGEVIQFQLHQSSSWCFSCYNNLQLIDKLKVRYQLM